MLATIASRADHLAGVDATHDAVELTRARLAAADVRVANVDSALPFADETFDTLIFCDVVEHVRSPIAALEELHRVLRSGGRMLLTTPNANSPIRMLKGRRWFALSDPGHVHFFTEFTLRHVLEKAGFRVVRCAAEPFTYTRLDGVLRALKIGGTLVVVAEK